jgi:hypothetical protein
MGGRQFKKPCKDRHPAAKEESKGKEEQPTYRDYRAAVPLHPEPKEHHGRDYALASAAALAEFLAVKYGTVWLAWFSAFLCWLAVFDYSKRWLSSKSSKFRIVARALAALAMITGAHYLVTQTQPPAARPMGAIESAHQFPAFREKESVGFTVIIGGNEEFYTREELADPRGRPIGYTFERQFFPISIHLEGDILYADASLSAGPSEPVIEIRRNTFEVKSRPPNWDINSSESAFEVVLNKEQTFPVFQMIRKGSHAVEINGIFRVGNPHNYLIVSPKGIFETPKHFQPLEQIFKYPSWKYPGQYAK